MEELPAIKSNYFFFGMDLLWDRQLNEATLMSVGNDNYKMVLKCDQEAFIYKAQNIS